jgi:hypothetical protein
VLYPEYPLVEDEGVPYNYHITKKRRERRVINIGGFTYARSKLSVVSSNTTMSVYSVVYVTFRMNDISRKAHQIAAK